MVFEEAVGRLEFIVRELERDDLDLDKALKMFEEGISVLRSCNERLSEADGRVRELVQAADGVFELVDREL